MRRVALLIALTTLTLAGCLSSDDSPSTPSPTATSVATSLPAPTVPPTSSATATATESTAALAGTAWQLTELTGDPVDPAWGVTLYFVGDEITGHSGCNDFYGVSTTSQRGSFTGAITEQTDADCPPPLFGQNFEMRYFDALTSSTRYFLDGPRLALHGSNDDTLLLFEPFDGS